MRKKVMICLIPSFILCCSFRQGQNIESAHILKTVFLQASTINVSNTKKTFINNIENNYVTYTDGNKLLGTILYKGSPCSKNIEIIYHNKTITDVENLEICNNKSVNPFASIKALSSSDYNHDISATPTTQNALKYFPINNDYYGKDSPILTLYSDHYTSYAKLSYVPNYMNTMFNHHGCTPTSFAMYLAYIQHYSPKHEKIVNVNLPISHTEDSQTVNNFIQYLGDNYFHTSSTNNTPFRNIASGMNEYLDSVSYSQYNVHETTDLDSYRAVILKSLNPVQIGIHQDGSTKTHHGVLGIGYRRLPSPGTPNGVKEMIIANYANDSSMDEIEFPSSYVYSFRIINKE